MLHEPKFWATIFFLGEFLAGGVALVEKHRKIGFVAIGMATLGLLGIFFFWPEAEPPAFVRIAYSSRQVIQISNIPNDNIDTLNLDNIALLRSDPPFTRESVALIWPVAPPITIENPQDHSPGVTVWDQTVVKWSKKITFDTDHPDHLIRVGNRVFEVSLKNIIDKKTPDRIFWFEYDFAISEVDPTPKNPADAISQPTAQPTPRP
jgi:hypothetical protein